MVKKDYMQLQTMPLRFRVWDKNAGMFLRYGGAKTFTPWCLVELLSEYTSDYYIKNIIISQDTGLEGKNGKNIYTGDIVKDNNTMGVMEYRNGVLGIRTAPHELPATTWIDLD